MAGHVFISHSSKDLDTAHRIRAALTARGLTCWLAEQDVAPGDDYQAAIVRAIRDARALLIVFTANANRSREVSKEVALANKYDVFIIPARLEDVAPSEALEYELTTRQWHDLFGDWDAAMDRLAARIARVDGAPERPRAQSRGANAAPATTPVPTAGLLARLWHPGAREAWLMGTAVAAQAALQMVVLAAGYLHIRAEGRALQSNEIVLFAGCTAFFALLFAAGLALRAGRRWARWPGFAALLVNMAGCAVIFLIMLDAFGAGPVEAVGFAASMSGIVLSAAGLVVAARWKA